MNDRLVNGTIGTVAAIRVSETSLLKGEILVQLDDLEAGKSRRIRGGEFKGVTRIRAEAKTFTLKGKSDVTVTRKQYPLSLAHSVTMHKSQGQTYDYVVWISTEVLSLEEEKPQSMMDRHILLSVVVKKVRRQKSTILILPLFVHPTLLKKK